MKNISDGVGISKASLYSHFSGKEDILFAVYEDLVEDYIQLHNRLFDEAKNMLVFDQLEHLFKGYILHYYLHREVQAFWEQVTFLTPPEIREKILSNLAEIDQHIHDKIVGIFKQAMDQQLIRKDHPTKMVVSFRSMRDGLLKWMLIIPKNKGGPRFVLLVRLLVRFRNEEYQRKWRNLKSLRTKQLRLFHT